MVTSKKSKEIKSATASHGAVKQKSPAEFFAENKNIAGFDNPGKSLYTTIRELVENGLDAAEAIDVLPEIAIVIKEFDRSSFNDMMGLKSKNRKDVSLYHDHETEKEKKKRVAREAREETAARKLADKKGEEFDADAFRRAQEEKEEASRGDSNTRYFTVIVQDNGMGMPHAQIPDMLGRVLSGTKYGLKQARGKFGLGAKMALIWAKMSTGLPIEVRSAQHNSNTMSYCKLDLDIHKNQPNVKVHEKLPNPQNYRGTELKVTIEGSITTYRSKIINYLRQMAVITPYAEFDLRFESVKSPVHIKFSRRSDAMPPPARVVKYHPSAVNLLIIKGLLESCKPTMTLINFLTKEFSCISRNLATRLIGELGKKFDAQMKAKEMDPNQLRQLAQLFQQARFDPPSGACLSPVGEYNLRLGIVKELNPDLVATYQESARVFEGHPFIVEAGVSLGGKIGDKDVKPGLNVYRFANRIPMLFEGGSDVVTRTAQTLKWSQYKINQKEDKIGIFVSIVSTKIPFKGTSKEYIGDDAVEIKKAVTSALRQCALQLKTKIVHRASMRQTADRKKHLIRYVPDVSRAIHTVLSSMVSRRENNQYLEPEQADDDDDNVEPAAKRQRLSVPVAKLLDKVDAGVVNVKLFHTRLEQHIERLGNDAALQQVMAQGMSQDRKVPLYIACGEPRADDMFAKEIHHPHAVFKLLQ